MFKYLILSTALVFSGCGVLSTVAEDKNMLAVQYATMKVLERDDVTNSRVLELIGKAKVYVQTDDNVLVSKLVEAARMKLKYSSLSAADQILIEVILTRAQERIEAKLGDGALNEDQQVQLLTVLNWIAKAASL